MTVVEVPNNQVSFEVISGGATPQIVTGNGSVIEVQTVGLVINNSGGGAAVKPVYEIVAGTSGAQTLTALSVVTSLDSFLINGLRQPQGLVTFSGATITVPASLNVVTGDLITAVYS